MSQGLSPSIPREAEEVSLGQLLQMAGTGDILLLSGEGTFSRIVEIWSSCRWSHVLLVYKDKDPTGSGALLYGWEATQSLDPPDLLGGTPRFKTGPKLCDLREKLLTYKGRFVALRQLLIDETYPGNAQDLLMDTKKLFYESMQRNIDHAYETDFLELGRSVFGMNRRVSSDEFFCTELAMQTLRECGIADARRTDSKPANSFSLPELAGDSSTELLPLHPSSPLVDPSNPLGISPPFHYAPPVYARLR
jgi:hypothetical protein